MYLVVCRVGLGLPDDSGVLCVGDKTLEDDGAGDSRAVSLAGYFFSVSVEGIQD
ncbi:hypothetical protein [uncultured Microbulbifer sp.]|uniref:hypothetical protein n=1 Tax=uncultured Microbulbifer sp. TaxID=348147 RepID=UPI0025D542C6|nr:hypothetical protein [uncultured Microbulbifer sp.]